MQLVVTTDLYYENPVPDQGVFVHVEMYTILDFNMRRNEREDKFGIGSLDMLRLQLGSLQSTCLSPYIYPDSSSPRLFKALANNLLYPRIHEWAPVRVSANQISLSYITDRNTATSRRRAA